MVPSPAVVTMNSEPQVLHMYLFPDSFANSAPLLQLCGHYSFRGSLGQQADNANDEESLCLESESQIISGADMGRLL